MAGLDLERRPLRAGASLGRRPVPGGRPCHRVRAGAAQRRPAFPGPAAALGREAQAGRHEPDPDRGSRRRRPAHQPGAYRPRPDHRRVHHCAPSHRGPQRPGNRAPLALVHGARLGRWPERPSQFGAGGRCQWRRPDGRGPDAGTGAGPADTVGRGREGGAGPGGAIRHALRRLFGRPGGSGHQVRIEPVRGFALGLLHRTRAPRQGRQWRSRRAVRHLRHRRGAGRAAGAGPSGLLPSARAAARRVPSADAHHRDRYDRRGGFGRRRLSPGERDPAPEHHAVGVRRRSRRHQAQPAGRACGQRLRQGDAAAGGEQPAGPFLRIHPQYPRPALQRVSTRIRGVLSRLHSIPAAHPCAYRPSDMGGRAGAEALQRPSRRRDLVPADLPDHRLSPGLRPCGRGRPGSRRELPVRR